MSVITPQGHGLGLIRQPFDPRDRLYAPDPAIVLLDKVDLRLSPHRPPIWNQGGLGSCTSFASARIAAMTYGIDGFHNEFEPSHLFIYWNSRSLEGTTGWDSGSTMRDAMMALVQQGICAEHWWPYNPSNPGPFTVKPPTDAYLNAAKHLATSYHAVSLDETTIKTCLTQGYPLMTGIQVHASFEGPVASSTGYVPMPGPGEQFLGGHATTILGFDDTQSVWICDNSWGPYWGAAGSFYLPYAYLLNPSLAYDAWTIRIQH